MKFARATASYEDWLGRRLRLLPEDLDLKHRQMATGPFLFLRATYYRWAQTWKEYSGDAARAPLVLAVGDLHVDNFGTWRDQEGRLVWGINDFDEAWELPYTNDLIRLAASALIARPACEAQAGAEAILTGYREALEAGGRPLVLAESYPALRQLAMERLHAPERYWDKLRALPEAQRDPPAGVLSGIARMMPEAGLRWRVAHRIAGMGSLGRERFVALAEWRGGWVAREAKALAPSAASWAAGRNTAPILYSEILQRAVRCLDPFVRVQKRWIVRRLAPDCSRIELSALPTRHDELRLLRAMGWETANIHLGSRKARTLAADLAKRPRNWLLAASKAMVKAVKRDFEDFRG
jgi:uncharacterized protein (DUF2252 family)